MYVNLTLRQGFKCPRSIHPMQCKAKTFQCLWINLCLSPVFAIIKAEATLSWTLILALSSMPWEAWGRFSSWSSWQSGGKTGQTERRSQEKQSIKARFPLAKINRKKVQRSIRIYGRSEIKVPNGPRVVYRGQIHCPADNKYLIRTILGIWLEWAHLLFGFLELITSVLQYIFFILFK